MRELADFFAIEALRRVLKLEWGLGCCSTSLKMPKFWMGTRQICIVQYCVCVYDKEVEQLYIYIYILLLYIYYSLERGKYLFPKNHSAHRPLHFCFAYAIVGK